MKDLRQTVFVLLAAAAQLCVRPAAGGEVAQFDLVGPSLSGTVTRGSEVLSLTQVPSFLPADKLLLKAELPKNQSPSI
jgi:hypothetical protein